MLRHLHRRQFIHKSAAVGLGTGLSLRPLSAIGDLPAASSAPVSFAAEIEPVVKWIEDTPREKILEVAHGHLKAGLSYRDLMAGVFLAGIRDIQPRPVGFKFHAVLVIQSAHQFGLTSKASNSLLPMLWALDTFKASQAADAKEGDWTLGRSDHIRLLPPEKAKLEFIRAMDNWDVDAADAATITMCRYLSPTETMEAFWRFAIRDHRNIGHKAIFAAQAWRTLQTIGWQHAEPVLRSLTFGLLDRGGRPGTDVIGPYQQVLEMAEEMYEGWSHGPVVDRQISDRIIGALRRNNPVLCADEFVEYLNGGNDPGTLWDSAAVAASELLLRKPGIQALHAVTSLNALHHIFQISQDNVTRLLTMLQAAAWTALFRDGLGDAPKVHLDELEPISMKLDRDEMVADIFSSVASDRTKAAAKTLYYLDNGGDTEAIFATARQLVLDKGNDSHDYKFLVAAFEEVRLAKNPRWKKTLTAAAMGQFISPTRPDNPYMTQAKEVIKDL